MSRGVERDRVRGKERGGGKSELFFRRHCAHAKERARRSLARFKLPFAFAVPPHLAREQKTIRASHPSCSHSLHTRGKLQKGALSKTSSSYLDLLGLAEVPTGRSTLAALAALAGAVLGGLLRGLLRGGAGVLRLGGPVVWFGVNWKEGDGGGGVAPVSKR